MKRWLIAICLVLLVAAPLAFAGDKKKDKVAAKPAKKVEKKLKKEEKPKKPEKIEETKEEEESEEDRSADGEYEGGMEEETGDW